MKKLLAMLPLFVLIAGCQGAIDSEMVDEDDDLGEAQQGITSFFGDGTPNSTGNSSLCASGAPIAKNPAYISGRVYVDAAGSCIMQGATMTLLVPWSTTTYGPYSLSFDDSGTRLRTASLGPSVVPAGSCRIVQITNPNGIVSNLPSFCR